MPHILLLEPDNLLAGSLNDYFANVNYSVAVHSDPQAAITSADKHRPNLVITELLLASRSGVEFLYEFRSYPEWQGVPIIIFTNLQSQETSSYSEVFNELNIAACLYKPTTGLDELLKHAERILTPIPG